jgi:hypothetical protein
MKRSHSAVDASRLASAAKATSYDQGEKPLLSVQQS